MTDSLGNVEVDQNEQDTNLAHQKLDSTSNNTATGNNDVQDISKSEFVVETRSGTGNDGQLQQSSRNHIPEPEPENIAIQGNNAPEPDPDDESTNPDPELIEFVVDDPRVRPEEQEVLNQLDKERKELLDANNAEDQPLPRPPESTAYRLLPSKVPEVTKLHDLKCSEVRWFYETKKGFSAFPDNDSLIIEIKYRLINGLELDPEAQNIFDDRLAHLNLPKILSTDSSDPDVFVRNGYYRIDKDNTKIIAEYWTDDERPIVRRTYFTINQKPVEEKIAEEIEKHLVRQGSKESAEFLIEKCRIVCHTTNEVTIQKPEEAPKSLTTYPKAEWSQPTEIEHLVFVVHGVGHYNKPNCIVESVKELIDGVDHKKFFIPIHWRSSIEPHTCKKECSKEHLNIVINKILPDVRLYDCTETGVKIRQSVISKIKDRYDKFKSNHPEFNGSVALFGHSLGSVICYDILTNFKNIQDTPDYKLHFQVDRLFTVGSPLEKFLKKREALHDNEGTSPIEQFCQIHEERSFKICNIYHPIDPVARRLDPLINESYREHLAIKIRRGRGFRLRRYIRKQIRTVMCVRVPPVDSGSLPQIDHEISGETWQDAHSCYWRSQDVHQHIRYVAFNNVVKPREILPTEITSAETSLMGVEVNAQVMSNVKIVPNENNEIGNDEEVEVKQFGILMVTIDSEPLPTTGPL
ncbi:unnamed protein product [Caenorhabditis brenneri]